MTTKDALEEIAIMDCIDEKTREEREMASIADDMHGAAVKRWMS